jgi:hypothetical protein
MADYLEGVFGWPSYMVVEIKDELYVTHPDGMMTYMATNKGSGTWDGVLPYVQPGTSIIKFGDPDQGCATYQRDYLTEGGPFATTSDFSPITGS